MLLVLFGTAAGASAQRAYHFSPSGDDAHGDGSAARPWASLERANALTLAPGDSLLFEGGRTFEGGISLGAEDAGTPEQPVVISSYGSGRATLLAGAGAGVSVYNAGGIEVSRVVLVGAGIGTSTESGISFYMDLPGGALLDRIRVDSVDVSGFGKSGLSIGSWNGRSGWRDVRVTRSAFHGNRDGMQTFSEQKGGIRDVYVGHSAFYENPGLANFANPSGSGLVLGGVDGALVEYCAAYRNGANNTNSAGPVGIWAYEANAVVIQHNVSWGNRTRGGDGGGFDLDGGVTNSVLQYNYSHGNDGAGFGLFQYRGATAFGGNVVRYNVSENDGRRGGYGGISVWGASSSDLVRDTEVYHNTIFVSPAASNRPVPSAIDFRGRNHRGLTFRNNLLVTTGAVPLVKGPTTDHARFEGNAYWPSGAAFSITWGGVTYPSLEAWREATGQEQLDGLDTGIVTDPLLAAPGAGGVIADPALLPSLEAYRLLPGSPLATAALDLTGRFGTDLGLTDFFGEALGLDGSRAVGAHAPESSDLPQNGGGEGGDGDGEPGDDDRGGDGGDGDGSGSNDGGDGAGGSEGGGDDSGSGSQGGGDAGDDGGDRGESDGDSGSETGGEAGGEGGDDADGDDGSGGDEGSRDDGPDGGEEDSDDDAGDGDTGERVDGSGERSAGSAGDGEERGYDASAAIALLIADVEALRLHHGTMNALVSKLHQAQGAAERGRGRNAAAALGEFVSHLRAQSGKKVPAREAERLSEAARAIIDQVADALAPEPARAAFEAGPALPDALTLSAPYPNPVADRATLRFGLPETDAVRVVVYDISGREVAVLRDGLAGAGWHEATIDASQLAAGVYVVRVTGGGGTVVKRLTVVR